MTIWVVALGRQSPVREPRVFEIAQAQAAPNSPSSDNRGSARNDPTLGYVQAMGMRADAGRDVDIFGSLLSAT